LLESNVDVGELESNVDVGELVELRMALVVGQQDQQ
jgi:hypothetical protein